MRKLGKQGVNGTWEVNHVHEDQLRAGSVSSFRPLTERFDCRLAEVGGYDDGMLRSAALVVHKLMIVRVAAALKRSDWFHSAFRVRWNSGRMDRRHPSAESRAM